MKLGFIGTGTIAAAFIHGVQRANGQHQIVVSPRSEVTSRSLAAKYPSVRQARSNEEVAAESDIVFLAMRPAQLDEALSGISFAPHQTIVSFVANMGLDEVQALAPSCQVARVIPLPTIEYAEGPVVCYPSVPQIIDLLKGMGDVVEARDEAEVRAFASISAFMSSYFELQLNLIDWLRSQGTGAESSSLYVRSIFAGLAQTALRTSDDRLPDLPAEHQTKGGLNERVREALLNAGWFDEPRKALAEITGLSRRALK